MLSNFYAPRYIIFICAGFVNPLNITIGMGGRCVGIGGTYPRFLEVNVTFLIFIIGARPPPPEFINYGYCVPSDFYATMIIGKHNLPYLQTTFLRRCLKAFSL